MLYRPNPLPGVKFLNALGILAGLLVFSSALSGQEPKLRFTLVGHKQRVLCLTVSPDGKTLASGGDDGTIRFWDVTSGKEQNAIADAHAEGWVHTLAFSPDGKTLASGGGGAGPNTVKLWDVGTRKGAVLFEGEGCTHPAFAFTPDGKTLTSAGTFLADAPLTFWDVTTRKQVAKTEEVPCVEVMALTPDGKTLVALGPKGEITSVQVETGKITATRKTTGTSFARNPFSRYAIAAAAVGADAKTFATVTRNADRVKLWDVASGKPRLTLEKPPSRVSCILFSPDGTMLVTGREDGTITFSSAATGKDVITLTGHTDSVCSATFSPDGKLFASGSEDQTINLWELPRK